MKKFTIRPKPNQGETLTSFLNRVVNLNKLKGVNQIWSLVQSEEKGKVDSHYYFRLDLYPSRVNLMKLGNLLGLSYEQLLSYTFEPICGLFYTKQYGMSIFSKEIEKKYRKFCKSCLRENGVYKLIWQIKGIQICKTHSTKIQSTCDNCGEQQPYLSNSMNNYMCNYCGVLLFKQKDELVLDEVIKSKYLRIYRDWESILYDSSWFPEVSTIQRKIAVVLLFLATPNRHDFSYRNHPNLKRNQVRVLIKLIKNRGAEQVSLKFFFTILRDLNIEIKELKNIKIPLSFFRFIFKEITSIIIKKPIMETYCRTSWCVSFRSTSSIKNLKLQSNGEYIPKLHLYPSQIMCTDCWIKLGFNEKKNQWEEINFSYDIFSKIITLINEKNTMTEIAAVLGKSYMTVAMYIGYIYRYNLTEVPNLIKENSSVLDKELLKNYFLNLKPYWRSIQRLLIESKKIYGWSSLETAYYYWDPDIQNLINLKENSRNHDIENREILKSKLEGFIEETVINQNLTLKEVASALEVTKFTLKYHNYDTLVKEERLIRKSSIRSKNEKIIITKINDFIQKMKSVEKQFYGYEIYEYLKLSPKFIKTNYPHLSNMIAEAAKDSMKEQIVIRKRELKNSIREVYHLYGTVNYEILSEYTGTSIKTLKSNYGIYKRIGRLIKETILEINET